MMTVRDNIVNRKKQNTHTHIEIKYGAIIKEIRSDGIPFLSLESQPGN